MSKMLARVLLMAIVCALCLAPMAQAAQGRAVYYDPPYTPSACYGRQNRGVLVAGVKGWLWRNRQACGKRFRVRCIGATFTSSNPCTGRSVDVTVVDFCREPCNGDLNLSRDAFAVIADLKAGNIRVQYYPI